MDTIDILNDINLKDINLKDSFISWIKNTYKFDQYSNDEYDILNIYTKVDYNINETFPVIYQSLDIEYHFPDIIMINGGKYLVGVSDYDSEIEYITIRIKK